MATKTITLISSKSARIYSPNMGSGASDQLPVGLWSGNVYRSLVAFTMPDWEDEGAKKIVSATLKLRNSTQVFVGRGGTPRMMVRRITGSWSEGSSSSLSTGNAVTYDNAPNSTSTNDVDTGTLSTTDNGWNSIGVTAMVRDGAPVSAGGSGGAFYGFHLRSFDEGSTSRTTEFYSDDWGTSSSRPTLVIVIETNAAPTAPTLTAPLADVDGNAVIAGITTAGTAKTIRVSGSRNDTDSGDYITGVQVQVYADSATDATPGTALSDQTFLNSGQPTSFALDVSVAALTVGTSYRLRVRTRDREAVWGAYSSLTLARFKPDSLPGISNPAVDVSTQTPNFYGSIVDPDSGAAIGNVRILVYQDTVAGAVLKWDSGFVASGGTRFSIAYGGTTLDYGTSYRWAGQIQDNVGGFGPEPGAAGGMAYQSWTPSQATGPSNMTPRTVETKQNTLTPTLTIGHASAFDQYELEVGKYLGGTADLWDVGVTSVASTTSVGVTYAGAALTWGRTFYWRAKVRVGGTTWTEWSPWYPFYINAIPEAPIVSVITGLATLNSFGRWITTDDTPNIQFPFIDPDTFKGYADVPTQKYIEIRKVSDNTVFSTYNGAAIAGNADIITLPTVVAGTVYKARARWRDSAGQDSPWGEYVEFVYQPALTASQAIFPNTTDPTPVIGWTMNRIQARRRFIVQNTTDGLDIYDSGIITTNQQDFTIPGDLLTTGKNYRAFVEVWDANEFRAEFYSTIWGTSFSAAENAGTLTAVPDAGASKVTLSWPQAADAGLFWRYYIYRLGINGAPVRVAEISNIATLTYEDFEAPHGTTTYYYTVSNGYLEGEPSTALVTLDLGYFIVDPADPTFFFTIPHVQSYNEADGVDRDEFKALGRDAPIIVDGSHPPARGRFEARLLVGENAVYEQLRRAVRVEPYVIFKTPFGDVYKAKIGPVEKERGGAGTQVARVDFVTVA